MTHDLHKKPFDEGTLVKLALYKNYIKEWLPVFLQQKTNIRCINIFDFFCGPGKDENGQEGSPYITLNILDKYIEQIKSSDVIISLFFNDNRKAKVKKLKEQVASCYLDLPYEIYYSTEDFEDIFKKSLNIMTARNTANFLFLDQNGIKHITEEIFKTIIKLQRTDFLFFISSSTLNRFNENPVIKKYLKKKEKIISSSDYYHIHRKVLEYYRTLIPEDQEYNLCPFSIKKGANIYGLIFGSGHLLGIDKFVNQCWKIDPQTGDSNYDIDNDHIDKNQRSLFPELERPKKVQAFEQELKEAVFNRTLKTNIDIYKYALFNGFKADHAKKIIIGMIKDRLIPYQKLNLSYSSCKVGSESQKVLIGSDK